MNLPLTSLIEQLIHAETWAEARQLVELYPQLLDESVEELMTALLVQRQNDSARLQRFRETQRLLQRCRQEGIEAAFAEQSLPPELNSILNTLTHALAPLDRTEKLALAQRGLSMVNQSNNPRVWAILQMYSANAVSVDTSSQRDQSQEQAIALYQDILPVLTAQQMMTEYATVSSNIAQVYVERIQGDRRANLQTAVNYYLQALQNQSLNNSPADYAATLRDLAHAYHLLKQLDQRAIIPANYQQFDQQLHDCQQVLNQGLPAHSPQVWAIVAASLGHAFFCRLAGERADNLEQAIQLYQHALTRINPIEDTIRWGSIQSDLGLVLLQREHGRRSDNLEQAKLALEQALTVRTRELQPWDWAVSMMNLAKVWSQRIEGDRQANLVQAVDAYQQVLTLINPQNAPPLWGQLMNDLGQTYLLQMPSDPQHYIKLAIQHLQRALTVRSRLRSPQAWAETLDNLATAYLWQIERPRTPHIEQAISLYQQVLTVRNRNSVPETWSETMGHLGDAYFMRLRGRQLHNLEQAIRCYEGALTVYQAEQQPQQWSALQFRLGTACMRRKEGRRSVNLKRAIACFKRCLTLPTMDSAPIRWADMMNNLGLAYAELSQCPEIEDKKLLPLAVDCLQQALTVYSHTRTPNECLISYYNLGYVYLCQQAWEAAAQAYRQGLAIAQQQLYSTLIPPLMPFLLQAAVRPVSAAAYCFAQQGLLSEAIAVLEQAELQALNSALVVNKRQLSRLLELDRQTLLALCNRIALLEQESRRLDYSGTNNFQRLEFSLRMAREQLLELIQRVQQYIPSFFKSSLTPTAIQALATQAQQPIIYLTIIDRGGLALLVMPNGTLHACWLNEVSEAELLTWIYDQDEVQRYLHGMVLNSPKVLATTLPGLLTQLQQQVLAPLADMLCPQGYTQALVIGNGRFSLLPLINGLTALALARLPCADVLPNLLHTLQRETANPARLLGVAEPLPQPNLLHFTTLELDSIRPLFADNQQQALTHALANRATIRKAMPHANYLHFGCYSITKIDQLLKTHLYLAADTYMTLNELLADELLANKRLLVLSSCQSSANAFAELPENLMSAAEGFLVGGTAGVLISLWATNSIATALLIKQFYHLHRREQCPPAIALHQAQQWLRSATVTELDLVRYMESVCRQSGHSDSQLLSDLRRFRNNPDLQPFTSPYFWAGLVFYGI